MFWTILCTILFKISCFGLPYVQYPDVYEYLRNIPANIICFSVCTNDNEDI